MAPPTVASILNDAVANGKIPYGVFHATNANGTFTSSHAAGSRTLSATDSAEQPIQLNDLFNLASQTKLLTTLAALQVVERGLIGLDDDTTQYLPDLAGLPILKGFDENDKPITVERKTPITLRHLLTHSSGCSYDGFFPDLQKWRIQKGEKPGMGTTMATRFTFPLMFEPGTRFCYGSSIDWAGRLVENLTGVTLQEHMAENILKPLGITTHEITFLAESIDALKSDILPVAARAPDGGFVPSNTPALSHDAQDCFGGHGASGRLDSYLKIMRSLLADDGKLLRPETRRQMFTSQINDHIRGTLDELVRGPAGALFIGEFDADSNLDWGLGCLLFSQSDVDRRKKGAITWGGYYNTFWVIDPEADVAYTFGTQLIPPGDREAARVITEIERAVYREAGVKF